VDEKDRSHRKEWKVIGSPLTATVWSPYTFWGAWLGLIMLTWRIFSYLVLHFPLTFNLAILSCKNNFPLCLLTQLSLIVARDWPWIVSVLTWIDRCSSMGSFTQSYLESAITNMQQYVWPWT
jgi:hypothetical protein